MRYFARVLCCSGATSAIEVPVRLPAFSTAAAGTTLQQKLEAAMILRGVVRVVLDDGTFAVEPRTWYRESGEHFLEARRRDSGEHVRINLAEIRDVTAY